jgi:hypothetical protein
MVRSRKNNIPFVTAKRGMENSVVPLLAIVRKLIESQKKRIASPTYILHSQPQGKVQFGTTICFSSNLFLLNPGFSMEKVAEVNEFLTQLSTWHHLVFPWPPEHLFEQRRYSGSLPHSKARVESRANTQGTNAPAWKSVHSTPPPSLEPCSTVLHIKGNHLHSGSYTVRRISNASMDTCKRKKTTKERKKLSGKALLSKQNKQTNKQKNNFRGTKKASLELSDILYVKTKRTTRM